MSFKPEFQTGGSDWASNVQRFETEAEALASAKSRFNVWTMATAFRATESGDPVNYRWDDAAGDVPVGR